MGILRIHKDSDWNFVTERGGQVGFDLLWCILTLIQKFVKFGPVHGLLWNLKNGTLAWITKHLLFLLLKYARMCRSCSRCPSCGQDTNLASELVASATLNHLMVMIQFIIPREHLVLFGLCMETGPWNHPALVGHRWPLEVWTCLGCQKWLTLNFVRYLWHPKHCLPLLYIL